MAHRPLDEFRSAVEFRPLQAAGSVPHVQQQRRSDRQQPTHSDGGVYPTGTAPAAPTAPAPASAPPPGGPGRPMVDGVPGPARAAPPAASEARKSVAEEDARRV